MERTFVSIVATWILWLFVYFWTKFGFSLDYGLLYNEGVADSLSSTEPWLHIVGNVLSAPIIETLLFQMITIELLRYLSAGRCTQLMISCFLFALIHTRVGLSSFICAGVIGGLYFSATYIFWRDRLSCRRAFWLTSYVHMISNGVVIAISFFWPWIFAPFDFFKAGV